MTNSKHIPVLKNEFLEFYKDLHIEVFFDGTLGAGGHAKAILEAHPEIKMYIGCDKDESAMEIAKETLEPWREKIQFVHDDFANVTEILDRLEVETVDGFFLTWECHRCS